MKNWLGFLIGFLFITATTFMISCRGIFVSEDAATRALRAQGFADVVITRRSHLLMGCSGCDGHDATRFDAVATNPRGEKTKVYVCVSWPFKGSTVRVE
jgi:hypothetical protein